MPTTNDDADAAPPPAAPDPPAPVPAAPPSSRRSGGRRRQRHDEHENHERWLVSYADFITLLFAFFVVMYAISQVNEGKYRVLSHSLIQAFQTSDRQPVSSPRDTTGSGRSDALMPLPLNRPVADPVRRRVEARMKNIADDIRRVLDPLVREGQVRVTESARGITVEINASVLFPSGQAELSDASTRSLSAVAQVLATAANNKEGEGHTDKAPIASPV
ncbi:MAG: hypothetical protein KIT73_08025, partial [Burkholderiales bacterium]|nr:hypothetical protein [Burkholderiales bacterium]